MDKYVKVQKQDPPSEPNEIRLPYSNRITSSIEHGLNLLKKDDINQVFMKAVGSSLISKAIFVAEIMKHRVAGLHQITEIGTVGVVTEYLPKEEGLDNVSITKQTPFIKITLSKTPLDTNNPGYQPPIPDSQVQPRPEPRVGGSSRRGGGFRGRGGRGRGRGRGRGGFRGGRGGFRGNDQQPQDDQQQDNPIEEQQQQGEEGQQQQPVEGEEFGGRGRGRGRGGFRGGRGRGGFRGRGRGGRGRGGFRGGRGRGGFRSGQEESSIPTTTIDTSIPTTTA